MGMKSVLLTGFEPFHKASHNPTQVVVQEIEKLSLPGVTTRVLPVVFNDSSRILLDLIDEINPDVVISLGQAEGRTQITPEKIAVNLDDARIEDNAGNQPSNAPVVTGGADGLFSTLPVNDIINRLKSVGIPAAISMSAGTFVCNHIFYAMQHHCLGRGIQSGFIHVPLMEVQASEFPGLPTMPLDQMIKAVQEIITELQQQ